jgi:hypothetical protein
MLPTPVRDWPVPHETLLKEMQDPHGIAPLVVQFCSTNVTQICDRMLESLAGGKRESIRRQGTQGTPAGELPFGHNRARTEILHATRLEAANLFLTSAHWATD